MLDRDGEAIVWKRLWRSVSTFDEVDHSLVIAAVVGGLGGLAIAIVKALPLWAYQSSALFFTIAVSFLLFRHIVLRDHNK